MNMTQLTAWKAVGSLSHSFHHDIGFHLGQADVEIGLISTFKTWFWGGNGGWVTSAVTNWYIMK